MPFRILTSLFLCCCTGNVFAQFGSFELISLDTSQKSTAFSTSFESNANTLSNRMVNKILWGGHIDKDFLQDRLSDLNKDGNHLGYEFKSLWNYRWQVKAHEWQLGIKYRELFGFNYTEDLFGLVFLGNSKYEGQTADLSNSRYGFWRYTGLQFGWAKRLNEGNSGKVFVGLSALYALNYQELTSKNVSLYTAPDGEYLEVRADVTLQYKDQQPGYGGGIDLGYIIEFGKNTFTLQVQDLGFMYFGGARQYLSNPDSNYRYRGEEIGNVNSFSGDSLFTDISIEGFTNKFGIQKSAKSVAKLLPFSLDLHFIRRLHEKWNGSLQFYYTYVPAYVPRMAARIERLFSSNWKANIGLAYGGFGRQNLLLGGQKTWHSGWNLRLEGYFLGMIVLQDHSRGMGLNIQLKKRF